jgi:hypothetical protein
VVSSRPIDGTTPAGKAVHGLVNDAAEPVHDFLTELDHPDLQDFYAAFEKLAEAPEWVQLGEWFKPMRHASNVWQVSSSNYRILGFRYGSTLVLTNCFRKTEFKV